MNACFVQKDCNKLEINVFRVFGVNLNITRIINKYQIISSLNVLLKILKHCKDNSPYKRHTVCQLV